MKEASVVGPFLKRLRQELPGSQVFKLHDASRIGLPDFAVTWRGRTVWGEAKLYDLPAKGDPGWEHWLKKAQEGSPVQAATVGRLYQTSASVYVIWVKKTCVYMGYPNSEWVMVKTSAQMAERFKVLWDNWERGPVLWRPSLSTSS